MKKDFLSLSQLNKQIQEKIRASIPGAFWVRAEIAQIKENYSGHCYLELIEKDSECDRIIAQSKATIWSSTYRILKPYFETTIQRSLCEGLNILVYAKVDFHEVYGLSLNIVDIDPSYTVGDIALKRAETIRRLQEEGVFDINRENTLAIVPSRIAIISSETAAGYMDFMTHINENPYDYCFSLKLFPAFMQGEKAEETIISALEEINNEINNFDAVVIIRGGGSQAGLSCFDSYWLALHVAQFPIPVLTGIGHEQDTSVVDMVAHTRFKTPTAVADFLIDRLSEFEDKLDSCYSQIIDLVNNILGDANDKLESAIYNLPILIKEKIHSENQLINTLIFSTTKNIEREINKQHSVNQNNNQRAIYAVNHFVERNKQKLEHYKEITELVNPENILKRGFSITLHKNKAVKDSSELSENDEIETRFYKGSAKSKIVK
jgi:exodeoxyribonuclease VII large subunit